MDKIDWDKIGHRALMVLIPLWVVIGVVWEIEYLYFVKHVWG